MNLLRPGLACLLACLPFTAPSADPNNYGVSGLVNMPDARIAEDGTSTLGIGYTRPYVPLFASMTVLPRVEVGFRYTRLMGVDAFGPNSAFGDNKDKAIDLKVVLLEESAFLPQLAFGAMDIHGTRLLPANYLVASKRFGDLDLSIGFGDDRLEGAFGGLRYRPAWARGFALALEQDGFDYANDPFANESGADQREGGFTAALEYRQDYYGARVSFEDGEIGARMYFQYPWGLSGFRPKSDEPPPLFAVDRAPEPRSAWQPGAPAVRALIQSLKQQDFGSIRVALRPDGMFEAKLNNRRITHIGRAVGRAARTILLLGPADITGLRITVWNGDLAIVTYEFSDIARLRGYFAGEVAPADFADSVRVTWPTPEKQAEFAAHELAISQADLPPAEIRLESETQAIAAPLSFSREGRDESSTFMRPINISTFFNDPSGALKYDLYATAGHGRRLGEGLFAHGMLRLSLLENVSDVNSTGSNSLLPHVRSDVGEYLGEGPLKLSSLMIAKYMQLDERVYARLSAGFYEIMFAGAGGEILWMPAKGNYAFAFTAEALRQRDFQGYFGFQDYSTVLALGTVYYQIPKYGVTLSARAGRFLAKDEGVRFEFARQLRSGFRFGVWYTVTNGNDITSPGSPSSPYRDKGAFVVMPFHVFASKDTRGFFSYAMSAWTRDVGAISTGPSLYGLFQHNLMLNHEYYNPLTGFGH